MPGFFHTFGHVIPLLWGRVGALPPFWRARLFMQYSYIFREKADGKPGRPGYIAVENKI